MNDFTDTLVNDYPAVDEKRHRVYEEMRKMIFAISNLDPNDNRMKKILADDASLRCLIDTSGRVLVHYEEIVELLLVFRQQVSHLAESKTQECMH